MKNNKKNIFSFEAFSSYSKNDFFVRQLKNMKRFAIVLGRLGL